MLRRAYPTSTRWGKAGMITIYKNTRKALPCKSAPIWNTYKVRRWRRLTTMVMTGRRPLRRHNHVMGKA